jgi:hypothetical protein
VDGKIQLPGGNYRVIVVPPCEHMPLETFKQLLALTEKGATIIFEGHLPGDVSGWKDLEKRRAEFRKMAAQLSFQSQETRAGKVEAAMLGKGKVFDGDLWIVLLSAGVWREPMVDDGLSFVRRSFDGGWNYFIANRTETNFDGWVVLGKYAKSAVLLDPTTGNSGLVTLNMTREWPRVRLQLRAGESVILRTFADKKVDGPAWNYWQTSGQPIQITGRWNVKFIAGGPVLPGPISITNLVPWTEFGDANTQNFAGTTRYSITFDASMSGPSFLDLGAVRQSARVKLNGQDYGTLIMPPFRVFVDDLKPKDNVLEVEVTGVAANRIRDLDRREVSWKNYHDINFVNIDYQPFNAANWPLTECGLLGPVTVTTVVRAPDR